jgi:hypothetical protein
LKGGDKRHGKESQEVGEEVGQEEDHQEEIELLVERVAGRNGSKVSRPQRTVTTIRFGPGSKKRPQNKKESSPATGGAFFF